MEKYSVVKNFGHFSQIWKVEANSEEEAWETADKRGTLEYQSVYDIPFKSKGHVVNLEERHKKEQQIPEEVYYEWLQEAVDNGMVCMNYQYKKLKEFQKREK